MHPPLKALNPWVGWRFQNVWPQCQAELCEQSEAQSTAPASLTMEIKQSWSDTTPAPSPPLCLTDSKPPIEATGWKGAILHVAPFSALPCQSLCVFRMKRERRLGKYGSFWKGQVWYLTKYAFAQEACPTQPSAFISLESQVLILFYVVGKKGCSKSEDV